MCQEIYTVSSHYTLFFPDSFPPSLFMSSPSNFLLPPGGGNGHILSAYCALGSLHLFSPFLFLLSPLSSLSGHSALFQGKEHTFIEHLWYAKQLLVLSLPSSRPPVSVVSAVLCFFLLSAREGKRHLLKTYCVPDNFLTLPPLRFFLFLHL